MTPRQLLDEAAATVAFLSRHRERHLRKCGCGGRCQQHLALVEAIADARVKAAEMERRARS